MGRTDAKAARTAGCGVAVVALTAAVISFEHVRALAVRAGESELTSWLLPVSIDGAIAAAVAVLLADSRAGRRPAGLTWMLLGLGLASSLAANVASAEPTVTARAVAGWPPVALALGIEVLSGLIRRGGTVGDEGDRPAAEAATSPSGTPRRHAPAQNGGWALPTGSAAIGAAGAQAGRPADRQADLDDEAAVALMRQLDQTLGNRQASRLEIQRALGCGGSRAARLARLARQPLAVSARE